MKTKRLLLASSDGDDQFTGTVFEKQICKILIQSKSKKVCCLRNYMEYVYLSNNNLRECS